VSPSRSASAGTAGGGAGRGAVTGLVIIGVVIGMVLLVRASPKVPAFDPRSSASNGANAAVLLLQHEGASVTISWPVTLAISFAVWTARPRSLQ